MATAPALATVLFNAERDAMLHGYKEGARLVPVWRELIVYETESTNFTKEADNFFILFNRDDRPGGMLHRSMSVGDVVLFETPYGRVALGVENVGFRPINVGILAEFFTQSLAEYDA